MPLFNYKCEKCGKQFEELVRSCSEKVACPECKSEDVKKALPKINVGASGAYHSHSGGG
jgi:putative FmdB family regulatory protein